MQVLFILTFAVHIALLLACVGYAAFLNQKPIYEWYHPKLTYITVIGGEVLVGIALGFLWLIGLVEWTALAFFVTLQGVAAIPIISWQRRQAKELDKIEQEARERP